MDKEELQKVEEDEKIIEVEIERLRTFKDHPFKVADDKEMHVLKESIEKYGILNPLIVRPLLDGVYEIISGHRRRYAAEQLGYRKVPVIIRVMTEDESIIKIVDSNLQRERISYSEKAFAYRMKNDALKRKGGFSMAALMAFSIILDIAIAIFNIVLAIILYLMVHFEIVNSLMLSVIVQALTRNHEIASSNRWILFLGVIAVCMIIQHLSKIGRIIFTFFSIYAFGMFVSIFVSEDSRTKAMVIGMIIATVLNFFRWTTLKGETEEIK